MFGRQLVWVVVALLGLAVANQAQAGSSTHRSGSGYQKTGSRNNGKYYGKSYGKKTGGYHKPHYRKKSYTPKYKQHYRWGGYGPRYIPVTPSTSPGYCGTCPPSCGCPGVIVTCDDDDDEEEDALCTPCPCVPTR